MKEMSPKEVVVFMATLNDVKVENWSLQIRNAKKLMEQYTWNEIKYALEYYRSIGVFIYSLGFLLMKNNMKHPLSMYTAESQALESENSGERNWTRIRQNSET